MTRTETAGLSAMYAAPVWRANAHRQPRWTNYSARKAMCNECLAILHETRGAAGPRRRPKYRRDLPGTTGLMQLWLCDHHADRWRERDRADLRAAVA